MASAQPPPRLAVSSSEDTRVLLVRIPSTEGEVSIDALSELFGNVEKIVLFSKERGVYHGLIQMDTASNAHKALHRLDGVQSMRVQFSSLAELTVKSNNARARDFRASGVPAAAAGVPGCVVIAYNVNPEISCEGIFNLFSFYGLVTRVKFLHSRPDAVLVQFANPLFASLAIEHLREARLHGQQLHLEVANMAEIIPSSGKFRQFPMKERRFGSATPERVLKSVCRPTALLHIANLSLATEISDLQSAIPEARSFRMLPTPETATNATTRMALGEFDSPEIAAETLVARHNQPVLARAMKLSFSRQSSAFFLL